MNCILKKLIVQARKNSLHLQGSFWARIKLGKSLLIVNIFFLNPAISNFNPESGTYSFTGIQNLNPLLEGFMMPLWFHSKHHAAKWFSLHRHSCFARVVDENSHCIFQKGRECNTWMGNGKKLFLSYFKMTLITCIPCCLVWIESTSSRHKLLNWCDGMKVSRPDCVFVY